RLTRSSRDWSSDVSPPIYGYVVVMLDSMAARGPCPTAARTVANPRLCAHEVICGFREMGRRRAARRGAQVVAVSCADAMGEIGRAAERRAGRGERRGRS